MTITWSRDIVRWNSKQPGCGCRVMETLPHGNKWKLMTNGGAVRAQVLDSCPLTIHANNNQLDSSTSADYRKITVITVQQLAT